MWNEKDYKVYNNSNIGVYIHTYKEQLEISFGLFNISSGSTLSRPPPWNIVTKRWNNSFLGPVLHAVHFSKQLNAKGRIKKTCCRGKKSCTNWRGGQAEILPPFDAAAMKSLLKNFLSNTPAHFPTTAVLFGGKKTCACRRRRRSRFIYLFCPSLPPLAPNTMTN